MTICVVAVDDSPTNLLMIDEFLSEDGYSLIRFNRPHAALKALQGKVEPDIVLLDRMMPGMDGIEFLREMRRIERFRRTPVIMQTAATTPRQIAEGLSEGVFYYLAKPFTREVLRAVLRNALRDHETYAKLEQLLHKADQALAQVLDCRLQFSTLADVDSISAFLARMYPDPADAIIGIRELMLNAVEHGNLGISYEDKTRLQAEGRWSEEIAARLAQPILGTRRARVMLERTAAGLLLTIEDQGRGFDWERYLSLDAERTTHSHGRGIAMSRAISFDDVRYEAPGNRVSALKRIASAA